jgi:hypothetical protein
MMRNRAIINILFALLGLTNILEAQSYYKADRLPFNTSYNEMAPVIFNNGLIFSSDRKNEVVVVTVDLSGNYLYNLYFSENKNGKSWSRPDLFSKDLLNQYNQSSVSITADGKTLYYTATTNATQKMGDKLTTDTLTNGIYIATRVKDGWSSVVEFPYNNAAYDVGYPSITPDGKRLYFASRNPEGFGGYDLYYSDINGSSWDTPVNLGPNVNTPENEVFPFIFDQNRLYFASRGLGGLGAMDIFYSDLLNGEWSKPIDMPEPFNSTADDFGLVSTSLMDTGYFTSNRRGNDDIYRFVSTFPVFPDCKPQVNEQFCYYFEEAGTVDLDTTSFKYEWDLGDGTKVQSVTTEHCYKEPGFYSIQLNVIDTLTGNIDKNQASYDLLIERLEQAFITSVDTAFVNQEIQFDASMTNIKKFSVQNYYWDFGDGTLGSDLKIIHKYIKPGVYIIKLGVTGESGDSNQKACVTKQIVIISN